MSSAANTCRNQAASLGTPRARRVATLLFGSVIVSMQ
jgi:hypothetical protein